MTARVLCCEQLRLKELKLHGTANAIEFIEVLDKAAPPGAPRQQTLLLRLLRPGFVLKPSNISITGGERIRSVGVLWCAAADSLPPQAEPGLVATVDDPARTLVVRTDGSGDHSLYTLSLLADPAKPDPPAGFDPKLSTIDFSFKVECPSDFDCASSPACPPARHPGARIDYLAKDYQGFRRLMLDRMSLLVPGWTERSAADMGVMLVELLAYAADNLSYRQDAIANEAYLGTARQRVSVRRHARLVDYLMHEGCNARAFVHVEVSGSPVHLDPGTQLLTYRPGLAPVVDPDSQDYRDALRNGALVFETAVATDLRPEFNAISFYTWGDESCCLPRGSTSATLRGNLRSLAPGAILVFEEIVSPTTLKAEDADLSKRWAVRLTSVAPAKDPSGGLFKDPPAGGAVQVTEIGWDPADALPFPLCLSARDGQRLVEISVARGNIVLADHGMSLPEEAIGEMPKASVPLAPATPGGSCTKPDPLLAPARFRPRLAHSPLTHGFDLDQLLAVPMSEDAPWWPASALLEIDARSATPRLHVTGSLEGRTADWTAERDLLDSSAEDTHFTVEIEDDGTARLRFGDGVNGKRPAENTSFNARCRVGNGATGNVGADSIRHLVSTTHGAVTDVRNPLPAAGGIDPEDIEVVRRDAPQAFRTQERAVTLADYAAVAERQVDVQRAAAAFRWTGSWYTVFICADRFGGAEVDAPFSAKLLRNVERFRMAGYDLDARNPQYVPLEIELHICVRNDYFRSDVLAAVEKKLSSRVLPDGSLGLFHPDNFTFGQPVYLSPIIAAAQAVDGVDAVQPILFRRMFGGSPASLADGVIPIGALEVAELSQNPDFPERGTLRIDAGGGK
jgi:hypothetical protein